MCNEGHEFVSVFTTMTCQPPEIEPLLKLLLLLPPPPPLRLPPLLLLLLLRLLLLDLTLSITVVAQNIAVFRSFSL